MSKPFSYSWDDSRSPLDRRPGASTLSPSSAGGSPTTYKTNVNRQKTKRWVEAKSYSYDGDDWGDVDDYDDYGQKSDGPPKAAQPTGLRQPGQTVSSASSAEYGVSSGVPPSGLDQGQKPHEGLPGQAPLTQQSGRGATNPMPPTINTGVGRARANSFDEGDENRAFSATQGPPLGTQPEERSYAPPTRFSQMGLGTPDPVVASPGVASPASGPSLLDQRRPSSGAAQQSTPQPDSRTSSLTMSSARGRERPNPSAPNSASPSGGNYQASRDFSPSAMPRPLQTRGVSPSHSAPVAAPDTSHGGRFPPRKSSLSQQNPFSPRASSAPPAGDGAFPASKSRSSSVSTGSGVRPASRERPGSAADKPRTFIRPADIYKRVEEEREKERKSLELGRRSSDSSASHRAADNEAAAAVAPTVGVKERLSSESLGRGLRTRQSLESIDGTESGKRLRPSLDPVRERKSEYGFEALLANASKNSGDATTLSTGDELPSKAPQSTHGSSAANVPHPVAKSAEGVNSPSASDPAGPQLPSLTRLSGFGDTWLSAPSDTTTPSGAVPETKPTADNPGAHNRSAGVVSNAPLQHQPSVGFRSAVHQAFDRTYDGSVPPTPALSAADSQRSTGGDGVKRTDSSSTSGISPIMSRVPSSAMAPERFGMRDSVTPAIAEEELPDSRRNSKSSLSLGSQNQTIARKPSPSRTPQDVSTYSLPLPFKPGHRRDFSTPSPSNSPKRSPVLELTSQLPAGEEVEVTTELVGREQEAPPAPKRTSDGEGKGVGYATRGTDLATAVNSNPDNEPSSAVAAAVTVAGEPSVSSKTEGSSRPPSVPPKGNDSRSGSPTRGRVRDLAGRFESGQRQQAGESERSGPTSYPRQSDESLESFRPVLPKPRASLGTLTGANASGDQQHETRSVTRDPQQPISIGSGHPTQVKALPEAVAARNEDIDIGSTTARRPSPMPTQDRSPKGPPARVSNPGVAEALTAVFKLQKRVPPDSAKPTAAASSASDGSGSAGPGHTPFFMPPMSKGKVKDGPSGHHTDSSPVERPQPPTTVSISSRSSIPPPPPPKDTQPTSNPSGSGSEQFTPIAPLKHKNVDQAADVVPPPKLSATPPTVPSPGPGAMSHGQEGDRQGSDIARTPSQEQATKLVSDTSTAPGMSTLVPDADRRASVDDGVPGQRPESSYLPSVYDIYFSAGGDIEDEGAHVPESQSQGPVGATAERNDAGDISISFDTVPEGLAGASAPVPMQRAEHTSDLHGAPLLRNRFSWENEVNPHVTSSAPQRGASADPAQGSQMPQRGQSFSSVTTADAELKQLMGTSNAYLDGTGATPGARSDGRVAHLPPENPVATSQRYSNTNPALSSPATAASSTIGDASRQIGAPLPTQHGVAHSSVGEPNVAGGTGGGDRSVPAVTGGAAAAGAGVGSLARHGQAEEPVAEAQIQGLSIAENEPSTDQVTPTPNIENHPGHSPTEPPEVVEDPGPAPHHQSQEATAPSLPSPSSAQPKTPTIREIMALKSPVERIKTYNGAREQLANMNSGLAHWIAVTSSRNQEAVAPVPQGGSSNTTTSGQKSTPPRSKFHKQNPSNPAPPLQEPYYKQYMNFSSTTASPTAFSSSTPKTPASTQSGAQGFSPPEGAGGHAKQSSQQAQHKRMDLLHTFGGKAGGAAKGLFAKGKSKLKGDKVDY
ncbi:hypothetical protein GP486_002009 [Trichoglossum hirsutum]|uniref:Uncharacterized protein n=1 Tax=Trichoglossum hirsutum TaxID=265104 RepID=A0A9P8RS34_9PEZI|nr:hypothetical protein GP486_002009 [Trichoglossum hirsutum]